MVSLTKRGVPSSGADPKTRAAWSAPVSLLGLIAILTLLDALAILPFSPLALDPHPFWLPIAIAAIAYGTAGGLGVAAIATLAHLAAGTVPHIAGTDFYDWQLAAWREPVLWLIAATVLGELRRHHDAVVADLGARAAAAREQAELAAEHAQRMRAHVARLERSLALGNERLEALCDLADAPAPSDAALAEAGARLLGARSASVLEAGHDASPAICGLVATLAQTGRALSVDDPDRGSRLVGIGAAALPVPRAGGGTAAIVVADLDPALTGWEVARLGRLFSAVAGASLPREAHAREESRECA